MGKIKTKAGSKKEPERGKATTKATVKKAEKLVAREKKSGGKKEKKKSEEKGKSKERIDRSKKIKEWFAEDRKKRSLGIGIDKKGLSDFNLLTPGQIALRSRRVYSNEEKKRIAKDMLERYTGHSIDQFQPQIILTNFHYYIERFNHLLKDCEYTSGSAFKASSSKSARVTIVEFGIGSSMAALIIELLAVVNPRAVLFLGMVGAVHPSLNVGDFILPIAAIRAEGVSTHFMPPRVPALPTFKIQKFVSQILVEHGFDYRTGTVHSTDLRFWEFDERFKNELHEERVLGVEMETAALFITGFASKVNIGALLLVSDCPMKPGGIKTKESSREVFKRFSDIQIELGIEIMADIAERGETIRHYRW